MIAYPDIPLPLRDGYGFQAVDPLQRTALDSGRARQRRRFTSVPTIASVTWRLGDVDAMAFEAWYRDALVDGAEWFEMPLKVPESPYGAKLYQARFTGIYSGPVLVSGSVSLWDFSAQLELVERPILVSPWGLFPQFIKYGNIIDLALNDQWPEA